MMNSDVKAKWVAALRSGQYKQGKSVLRSNTNEYCCLGVLCEVMGLQSDQKEPDGHYEYRFPTEDDNGYSVNTMLLPKSFATYLGCMTDPMVLVEPDEYPVEEAYLSRLNDHGASFNTIAQLIEDQL